MGRGKRYETSGKLNYQKVIAVILALAVIIMFIFIIKNIFKEQKKISKDYDYFTLYAENKWGVINQDGEEVIQPSYQEMIVIPNKEKAVFICTYNVNEEAGTYQTKAINNKNEEILTGYDQIEALVNIDKNENVWYEENVLRVKKENKYGLIDLNGKELLPIEYDEIAVLAGIENSLIIKKDGREGLVNDNGSIIIEPKYTEIKNLGDTYKEGYITIDENGKYGIVSTTKKQILENKYDEITQTYLKEYYLVKENGKQVLINSTGTTLLEDGFDDIKSVTKNGIIFVKNDMCGEMTINGEVKLEPKYQDLKETQIGIFIAKQDDKYGIIDEKGEVKIEFDYAGITYSEKAKLFLAENSEYQTSIIDSNFNIKITGILSEINTEKSYLRMRINDEYKYYDFRCNEKSNTEVLKDNTIFLNKKDGKYGYVDKKGNQVTDYIYDDATEQNEYGYVAVKKNGLWGSLDKNGKEVITTKYNLENNIKIDFIGKWHLGEDLSMNYYCEK